jgi:glycerophosphoryl diester phosphodiesterase
MRVSLFNRPAGAPLIIAHRGASGLLPEQTIEAFDLAAEQGADAIELDVAPTRDGHLIARHENDLSVTTNAINNPEFASRGRTKAIDGGTVEGIFSEDFTLTEVQTLRARQRFPFRDHSHDDRFLIPTLDQVLEWKRGQSRSIAVFIEIKHPTYFASLGLDPAKLIVRALAIHDLRSVDAGVVLMSFETHVLRELRRQTNVPLVQLLDAPQARPFDWESHNIPRTYADLITPEGLVEIANYADGIGPWKRLIVPSSQNDADGSAHNALGLAQPTSLVHDAHTLGLFVCTWTFRDEPQFLASPYAGNPAAEYRQFAGLGVDGLVSDFPASAISAVRRT